MSAFRASTNDSKSYIFGKVLCGFLVPISFGMLVAWLQADAYPQNGNKKLYYFVVTGVFGIVFSFTTCFFLTVWRKSSSLADLVNYLKFAATQDMTGEGEKDVRELITYFIIPPASPVRLLSSTRRRTIKSLERRVRDN